MIDRLRREYAQFVTSGAQLVLLFFGAQSESREGWLTSLGLIALLSLVAWLSTLRRRRAIADTPTSRIASAAQGYVELRGRGLPFAGTPILSPLSGLPCLWYRYQVEENDHDGKWRSVERGQSDASFIVDDGSGVCVVDPEQAEILTRSKEVWRVGDRRHSEWKLLIGDPIYALGEFQTIGGATLELDAAQDLRELLAEWKKDRTQLLDRYDLDRDGELSVQEWALARQAARREVSRQHCAARAATAIDVLRRPADGRLYLLANLDPDQIAQRYLGWSAFHLVVFFAALGAIPWVWQHDF
jgi:hypothetical protein